MPETLEKLISGALTKSEFPPESQGRYFAPKCTLNLITRSSVTRTLRSNSTSSGALVDSEKEIIEFVIGKAQEIFAIGICMHDSKRKLKAMIQRFMDLDISDSSLPISEAQIKKIWHGDGLSRRSFEMYHHCFRSYDFSKQDKYSVVKLQPKAVLPVMKPVEIAEGQFGVVYKVRVHKGFLDADHPINKTHRMAAIKRLKAPMDEGKARKAWGREVKALQSICRLRLANVVEIAAMMTIGTKQYLVFPWAHGGNLRDFWKRHNGRRSDIVSRHIPDIVEQLVGLAGALTRLHAFQNSKAASYRHGDLKPENILVFDNDEHSLPGIWKLTDLGLARYHMNATGERLYVTSNSGAGTISYQPPERFKKKAAPTTRLYDIWSMGCIILQLMTWLLYGKSRLDDLTRTTNLAPIGHQSSYWHGAYTEEKDYHKVKIHPKVKSLIIQMQGDTRGSKALQALLSIIEDELLVIRLPKNATVPEKGRRTNASGLHQSLLKIKRACKDTKYWFHRDIVTMIEKQTSRPQAPKVQTTTMNGGKGGK